MLLESELNRDVSTDGERLHEVLRALPKPCGVFAANDVTACFVIETARFCGIGIPGEIGVTEYILQRRIEYAKDLLRTGELNVNQETQACGFPIHRSFFRVQTSDRHHARQGASRGETIGTTPSVVVTFDHRFRPS